MTTINQLNQVSNVQAGDLLALFSTTNGVTQNVAISQLAAYILSSIGNTGLVTQYSSPNVSGFSVSINAVPNTWLLLTPLAVYAVGAIILPASPSDQDEVNVSSTQAVTALTVSAGGRSVNGAPSALTANGFFTMRYDGVNNSWYRVA